MQSDSKFSTVLRELLGRSVGAKNMNEVLSDSPPFWSYDMFVVALLCITGI
jgi:hypothetical protein